MKNSLIKKMYVILIITTMLAAGGVYAIVYFTSQSSVMEDVRARAISVKDYILGSLDGNDFVDVGRDTDAGRQTSMHVQTILDTLSGVGGLKRLYIAALGDNGEIITTINVDQDRGSYRPSGRLEADLRQSINTGMAVFGDRIYQTDEGGVFTIFWPVMDQHHNFLGVVCMEFDVNHILVSNARSLTYGLIMAGGLLLIISVISYLSMNRATEPYFKKLAYSDFLTGYENRMAFEHRLREVGNAADRGERVTLIICDVNNLKTINDTQGHKVGDAYIRNTADIIFDNLGGAGKLYRIGGDEFAAIIVGKRENDIEKIMSALKDESRIVVPGQPFSCACGAATFTPGVDKTMRDVFKRSDDAMYEEKKRQKEATAKALQTVLGM